VRPRVVRASTKPASKVTSVSTPASAGIEARGVGSVSASEEEEEFEGVDVSEVLEQAAMPTRRIPAEARLIAVLANVRMMFSFG
jgi:hypothetical protein